MSRTVGDPTGREARLRRRAARHGPMEKGIGDVRRLYEGEVVFADELMALDL